MSGVWVSSTWREPTIGADDQRTRLAFDSLARQLRAIQERWLGVPVPTHCAQVTDQEVLLYGQTLTGGRLTHPDLWAVIDSTCKSGDDIVLPDYRGRVPVGLDNMGGSDAGRLSVSNTLGGTGGAQAHTLTEAEMPSHTHNFTRRNNPSGFGTSLVAGANGGSDSTSPVTLSAGSGDPHNNMQPYILCNWKMLVLLT